MYPQAPYSEAPDNPFSTWPSQIPKAPPFFLSGYVSPLRPCHRTLSATKGTVKRSPNSGSWGSPFLSAVMTAHPDSPPSVHGIGHAHLGLRNCAGGIIICNTHLAPALLSVPSRAPDKLVGAAPDSAPYRESVSLVILRGSPPEGRLSGTVYPLQSIVDQGNPYRVLSKKKSHGSLLPLRQG